MTGLIIAGIVISIVIIAVLFINLSPEFGGSSSKEDLVRFEKSGNFKKGVFINSITTTLDLGFSDMVSLIPKYFSGNSGTTPNFQLPVNPIDSLEIVQSSINEVVWFGHSAILLKLNGLTILLDPMLGPVPAPHPWLGSRRFNETLPITLEKLPKIDAVFISHDHYDHLDYGSIQALKAKTSHFFVPLGVANHLKAWGIHEGSITEMNWWEETEYMNLKLAFTPSRHFSGRGVMNRNSTLWGSWVIKSDTQSIYFSGDSGYGPHFKEIGEKYGPFNFAMMECGQYNELWKDIHMMPEQTAQAAIDIRASRFMPIHWGAFKLALHEWTDPIDRVEKKANELQLNILTPEIGQPILLDEVEFTSNKWWINPSRN